MTPRAKLRVLALVPYPTLGASNRLRVEQYIPMLRVDGIDITLSPYLGDAGYRVLYQRGRVAAKAVYVALGALRRLGDLLTARTYDLVLVHRETAPVGPPLVERVLAKRRVPYVFDFDDAIFLPAIHPANRPWAWLRRPNPDETAKRARSVISGNEYLAAWALQRNARVVVIPTPVDTERHRPRTEERNEGPIVIGWVGSSTTAPYLRILDAVFARLAGRHRFVVRVIGGAYEHEAAHVECVPYSLADEPAQVRAFDIGVLPEPDDAWTRGKGAFKGLLYMASGVPVVASRVGVNEDVIGPGGYCVDDEDGWIAALERLLTDGALRRSLGALGRRRAVERYSLAVQAPRLAAALRDALV